MGTASGFPFVTALTSTSLPNWSGVYHRVQVKTTTVFRKGRYEVSLATRGGNQSWSGRVKTLDSTRYDYLFVLVADGRKWFIPAPDVGGGSGILLGGPKYARFEVDRGSDR